MGNSIHTRLRINNHTSSDVVDTLITEIDSCDWDGVSRPDRNMQNRYIPVNQSIEEREEVNARAKNCPFRITVFFMDRRQLSFRIHQKHAIGCCSGLAITRNDGVQVSYRKFGQNGLEITFTDSFPVFRANDIVYAYDQTGCNRTCLDRHC